MMADNPFLGVGWNRGTEVYLNRYMQEPIIEPNAIVLNDYLMIGALLGTPALLCFVGHLFLKFYEETLQRDPPRSFKNGDDDVGGRKIAQESIVAPDITMASCRAAVLALVVGFWFGRGLANICLAAPFWMLLELGSRKRVG